MRVLILGATGAVGTHVLRFALADQRFTEVVAPTRKPIDGGQKLNNPIIDYAKLTGDEHWWACDVVICSLGTTLKQAGSKARFFAIDHDYVVNSAKWAIAAKCSRFVYVSSRGADVDSKISFYLRTKGLIEQHLAVLGFEQLTIVRPPLLDAGKRPDRRIAEEFGLWLGRHIGFLLPRSLQSIKTDKVAQCLIEQALNGQQELTILEASDI